MTPVRTTPARAAPPDGPGATVMDLRTSGRAVSDRGDGAAGRSAGVVTGTTLVGGQAGDPHGRRGRRWSTGPTRRCRDSLGQTGGGSRPPAPVVDGRATSRARPSTTLSPVRGAFPVRGAPARPRCSRPFSAVEVEHQRFGPGPRRRHAQRGEGEAHHPFEHRRGDLAAVEALARVVEHDLHDDLGVVGRGEADERRDVAVVAAVDRVVPLRRARLAGDPVPGDLGGGGGALRRRDGLEHAGERGGGLRGDHPALGRPRGGPCDPVRAGDRVHQPRRDPHAAVRHGRVDRRHLQGRGRGALAVGDGRGLTARPVRGRRQDAGGLAGEVDLGRLAEPERAHHLLEVVVADPLGDEHRPDVAGPGEHAGRGEVLGAVRLRVRDRHPAPLDGRRHGDRGRRLDQVPVQCRGHGDDLVDAAGLEGLAGRAVSDRVDVPGGDVVRVELGRVGHREQVTRLRVHHDDRAAVRLRGPHRLGDRALGVPLDVVVDGEAQCGAADRVLLHALRRGDLPPGRVGLDLAAPVRPAQHAVVGQLQAAGAHDRVVLAELGEADEVGAQGQRRVPAPPLGEDADAAQAQLVHLVPDRPVEATAQVHEPHLGIVGRHALAQRVLGLAEQRGQLARRVDDLGLVHQPRVRVHGPALDVLRQRVAVPVCDHATVGGQDGLAQPLLLGLLRVVGRGEALQLREPAGDHDQDGDHQYHRHPDPAAGAGEDERPRRPRRRAPEAAADRGGPVAARPTARGMRAPDGGDPPGRRPAGRPPGRVTPAGRSAGGGRTGGCGAGGLVPAELLTWRRRAGGRAAQRRHPWGRPTRPGRRRPALPSGRGGAGPARRPFRGFGGVVVPGLFVKLVAVVAVVAASVAAAGGWGHPAAAAVRVTAGEPAHGRIEQVVTVVARGPRVRAPRLRVRDETESVPTAAGGRTAGRLAH
ncbi:conserved hypothetical protein [Frankia sp. Hr75.2]|nr:conserved hypothetical protein [Frankia sp. Hr75.2]